MWEFLVGGGCGGGSPHEHNVCTRKVSSEVLLYLYISVYDTLSRDPNWNLQK